MNFRNAALAEFSRLAEETENYTEGEVTKTLSVGQLILAVLKNKPKEVEQNEWLMNVSDEDMYTAIEETKLKERP